MLPNASPDRVARGSVLTNGGYNPCQYIVSHLFPPPELFQFCYTWVILQSRNVIQQLQQQLLLLVQLQQILLLLLLVQVKSFISPNEKSDNRNDKQIISECDPFTTVGSSMLYYNQTAIDYHEAIASCAECGAVLVEIWNEQEWSEVKSMHTIK